MLLSVALVMAVMTVASVMPAFAQGRGEGAQGEAVGPQGETLAKEFLSSRKLEPRASREISPSRSGGRSPRQALITLQEALFAPLQGLLSIPQKDANRR
jgi:hypothetical protein